MFTKKILFLLFLLQAFNFPQDIRSLENNLSKAAKGEEKSELLLKISGYYSKRNPSKSFEAAKDALKYSEQSGNKLLIGRSYIALGEYQYLQGNNNSAVDYYNTALESFRAVEDKPGIADVYAKLSNTARVLGEFDIALEYSLNSLDYHRQLKDSSGIAANYNELGLIYRNLGETEKSFSFLNDALKLAQHVKDNTQVKRALNYIGNYYYFLGKIDDADKYYLKAKEYFLLDKIEDDFYAGLLNNLGNCRREKKEYADAYKYYYQSLLVSKMLGDKNLQVVTYKNIGITKKRENNFEDAVKYLLSADTLAGSIGMKRFQKDIALEISNLYRSQKKYSEALDYHIKYSSLNDSIFNQEISSRIKQFELKSEKQKAQEAITSYKLSQEIQFRNFLIVILLLTVITLALVYYFYRSNKRSHKKINRQREELLNLNNELKVKNRQLEEFEDFVNRTKAIIVVWRTESDFPIQFISKNVKEQLGFSDKDFMSGERNWKDLIHPEDLERIRTEQMGFVQNRVTEYSQQYRLMNAEGEYRWFEDHNKLIIDRKANTTLLQAVVLDINERKELEQQLINYTEELKELNKIKDKFFSIVAHDLKSPFLGLMGLSKMLFDKFDTIDQEQRVDYISAIHQMIKRVYKLIENLLDWSRIQLNKFEINIKEVTLKPLCESVVEIISINAAEKNITIKNLLPDDLVIHSDDKMITSMLSNLISNSIKFTNVDGVIKIYSNVENDKVKITVEDNGVGIPPGDIDNIFKVDQKLSTMGTSGEKGTGLGLIITKEMTEKLGGEIYAESEVDKWTRFTIVFPLNGKDKSNQQ